MDERRVGLRMVRPPVVEAASGLDADVTADLSSPGFLAAAAADPAFRDRLVPGPGFRAWLGKLGAVLWHCRLPFLPVAVVFAALMHLLVARIGDAVVAAPLLGDLAGGFGLLLLPLIWVCLLAMSALPIVLCLVAVVSFSTAWGRDGRLPGPRAAWQLAGHRLGLAWAWLTGVGALAQALPSLTGSAAAGSRVSVALSVLLAVVSSALVAFMGLLGCVVLAERGRGPHRALQLLSEASRGGVLTLVAASAALTVLPAVAALAGGFWAAAVSAVCGPLWAVSALVTYAQARRAEGPVSSGSLSRELML